MPTAPTMMPASQQQIMEWFRSIASTDEFQSVLTEALARNDSFRDAVDRSDSGPTLESEEAAGMTRLLAVRAGESREETLLKALTLYGIALDAIEKGNHLAILNPEDEILREITGFESSEDDDPDVESDRDR